ncbi:putative dna-directed rna polymerase ii subunit rpb1 protein [Eutypa lata UCREL1]|uniref:Putative dna-directed rna polymerase ii subunit rpb1 protein n=1 Tax=Eutypa lata (strain UCR-EL1) TaxID=1287681 RepID=M7TPB2_EUTLA|nr:putative dna-directed rna polymerase ii subunit rpb1 protein [Eutypa lata UCREL1]
MNAHALLTSQGWRGTGHSLHPTSDGNGLKHHILIKRNDDGRGLGSKKDHKAEAWWMNAFDQALKGIDTAGGGTMKQKPGGGESALAKITSKGAAKYMGSRGLYQSFVRGGVLEGTTSDFEGAGEGEGEGEGRSGLLTPPDSGVASPAAVPAAATTYCGDEEKKETKEERRARREARRLRKEQRRKDKERNVKAAVAKRAAKKVDKKKAKKAERKAAAAAAGGETKEERRARRDAGRRRKEEKRRMKASSG